jgi:cell division protein FtsQ
MKLFTMRGALGSRRSARIWGLRFRKFCIAAAAAALLSGSGYYCWKHNPVPKITAWAGAEALAATSAAGFKVEDVLVTGRVHISSDTLLAHLGVRQGEPIFGISVDAAQKSLSGIPWVRRVTVTRRLPDAVLVDVTERTPAALWQYQQKISVIDAEGRVLTGDGLDAFQGLPLLVGEDAPLHAGELLALLAVQPTLGPEISAAVRVGGRRWDLKLKNGILVRLPEAEAELALARLARGQQRDGLLNKDVTVIDLRFAGETVIEPVKHAVEGATAEKNHKTI